MSHHQDRLFKLKPVKPTFKDNIVTLPVAGQGVIIFSPEGKTTTLNFSAPENSISDYQHFSLTINKHSYTFNATAKKNTNIKDLLFSCDKGYEKYPKGLFWFSIDFENRLLKGGYGEPRAELALFSFRFSECGVSKEEKIKRKEKKEKKYKVKLVEGNLGPNLWPDESDNPFGSHSHPASPYLWLKKMDTIHFSSSSAKLITVFTDPITVSAAMEVKDMNHITMGDVSNYTATVPVNLPSICQQLYENVGGINFNLESVNKDFNLAYNFDLAKAIQYSIDTKGKICNKIIESKNEFGDPDMVYLRITMGGNQGESPGIPYVMEIWPSGKYSPIHNHGGSEAIIKVLHGQIDCKLYATLAKVASHEALEDHKKIEELYEPNHFKTCTFKKDQVTYITPWLNQIHQLKNTHPKDACITIQCYGYPDNDETHYEYFNWLDKNDHKIDDFFPDSDYNFNEFVKDIYSEYMTDHKEA